MAKEDHNFTDNVLIKLRRKYSKDEVFSAMDKKLKELEYKSGQDESEILYLKYEVKRISSQLKQAKENYDDIKTGKIVDKTITRRNAKIKKLEIDLKVLRNSNSELIMRLNEK